MKNIYPDLFLDPEILKSLQSETLIAEQNGLFSNQQLQLIHRNKWFGLFVPESYGGLELSLPDAVRLEENIAFADGSIGWVVTLCAGAGLFIGYMDEELRDEVFSNQSVCIAGSGQVNGIAKPVDGGFKINGSWPYASGAPYAEWLTCNCRVEGEDKIMSFIFKRNEVMLNPNWNYAGLKATAGFSYSVNDLFIPSNRAFMIDPGTAVLQQPVYRYPFLQLAETTIAVNISGMCLQFFQLAHHMLTNKKITNERAGAIRKKGLRVLKTSIDAMHLLRKNFYTALDDSWSSHISGPVSSSSRLSAVSETSRLLAQRARRMVNEIYPYCGMEAARNDSMINLVWRNINMAAMHSLLL